MIAVPLDPVKVSVMNAVGADVGVADAVVEYEPVPIRFTAATWKSYPTPLVRPVTVAPVEEDVPSAKVFHAPGPDVVRCGDGLDAFLHEFRAGGLLQ